MQAGQLLAGARKRAGLRQWEAAQRLHLDRVTLSLYEAGRRPVPRDVLYRAGLEFGAPELVALAGEGPFAVRFATGEEVGLALDWLLEEIEEATAAARRMVRSLRRGEAPRPEDAEQVVDLRYALDTFLVSAWREGCPVLDGWAAHAQKVAARAAVRRARRRTEVVA